MEVQFGRRLGIDPLKKPYELLVPMVRHAVADYLDCPQ
jgi:hypothetical protein